MEIAVRLPQSARTWGGSLASLPVARGPGGRLVELGEVTRAESSPGSTAIFRRDGRDVDMVMAELAGAYEAPIYGLMAVDKVLKSSDWGDLPRPDVRLNGQPSDEARPTVLWDGEWEITWVTFRDMGAAFGVAILGIYVLVVAQFRSFRLPLVILTPIPLTLVGIVIGHILFRAPFTATSMIGFIALAGIIVRNSILLVDFIRHTPREGRSLREVLLEAGAIQPNERTVLVLTGTGDVLEPEDGVIGIGSGGNYALAAARALMPMDLDPEDIARRAMGIAADICVYTNRNITIETIEKAAGEKGAGR